MHPGGLAAGAAPPMPLKQTLAELAQRAWQTLCRAAKSQAAKKKHLRVCENVSLGDKRFVALVQVDEQRFLIGGGVNSVAMLARLSETAASSLDNQHSQGPIENS